MTLFAFAGRALGLFAAGLIAAALAGPAGAAGYPERTISIIVPYPAGGTVDTRAAARANPDGYTLLLGHTGTISITPALHVKLGMNPQKDFVPIGLVASMPVALLVRLGRPPYS